MGSVLQNQVYRLGCKVRSLGEDKFEIIKSDVAKRYTVNKFNRRIAYEEFDFRKKDMRPLWNQLISSYIEDGFNLIKNTDNCVVFEKKIDEKYLYIALTFSDFKDDYIYRHVIDWNASHYSSKQKEC